MTLLENDPLGLERVTVFAQGLGQPGWIVGRNVRIDYRWGGSDLDLMRKFAAELIALSPDVVVATSGGTVGMFQQVSRTVPIVFVTTIDPVGSGFVQSLARPGTNATGFTSYEFSIGGKWLELLKEIAPQVTRVAVIRDPTVPAGFGGFAAIQTVAPSFRVELTPVGVHGDEIARDITAFARGSNGGLIVVGPPSSLLANRNRIVGLAAEHRLPAVYSSDLFVTIGGLISYGIDGNDQYRRGAGYVDRILKGEKPGDLPVQAPTKYGLVINLKTAKALGLEVPIAVRARADEVIE
jgi:putative ABC transport system substrate-binding protein